MRSFDSKDDHDVEEAKRLGAEPWMLETLSLNPEYVFWGPGEDYMPAAGKDTGWASSQEIASWSEFSWRLDELNECVNFYFQIRRDTKDCECESGYNRATKRIADDFYDFGNNGRRGWHNKITQDEVDALQAAGRLRTWKDGEWQTMPLTAEQVNRAQAGSPLTDYNHDAINRGILIETRAKRMGVYGLCEKCDGHAYVYTEPTAHLSLVLWKLHPRKGAARGVEIKHLDRADVPKACAWLKQAAERNQERFAKAIAMAK